MLILTWCWFYQWHVLVVRLNISKMSLTYQEKSKSLFFLSHLYDFLVVRLIFAVYQKKNPSGKWYLADKGYIHKATEYYKLLKFPERLVRSVHFSLHFSVENPINPIHSYYSRESNVYAIHHRHAPSPICHYACMLKKTIFAHAKYYYLLVKF